ncbi:MAG: winged helix family transcriptional regulator [Bacteroidetes bacterium]|nr:MAG: winged helix family transcriptional regulator [Bacteroidota bacterium]
MALCAGGGQEEMIAALAAGADDVLAFPIYLPLLQSKIAACRRLMDAVRQATSIDLEPEPEKQRRNRVVTKDETRVNDGRKRARAPLSLNGGSGRNDAPLPEARSSEVREEPDASPPPPSPPRPEQDEGLVVGPLRLDLQAFRFFVHGEEVELTPKEFDLIRYLMQHAGTVCPRDQILDEVWGLDFDTGTNMVDVYMHFLRRKLAAHGLKGMIKTIRGRGYRLDGQPTPAPHPGSSSPQ